MNERVDARDEDQGRTGSQKIEAYLVIDVSALFDLSDIVEQKIVLDTNADHADDARRYNQLVSSEAAENESQRRQKEEGITVDLVDQSNVDDLICMGRSIFKRIGDEVDEYRCRQGNGSKDRQDVDVLFFES